MPASKFYCTGTPCWPKAGTVGLVSQSGNLGTQLLAFAEMQGIGIRAFSGSGNEAMITIEDYLHAFGEDPETKTVVLYIESIKDGRRFFSTAREVSTEKPIIVLKGGPDRSGEPCGCKPHGRHGLQRENLQRRVPTGRDHSGGSANGPPRFFSGLLFGSASERETGGTDDAGRRVGRCGDGPVHRVGIVHSRT